MSVVTATWVRVGEPYTVADLDAMPDDDGRRRELVDGVLVVSPAPSWRHQHVSTKLIVRLLPLVADELELIHAPFDVRTDAANNLQPDLLIARTTDFTEANLPVAPLLAVEILSPSTRHLDLGLKRSKYEAMGTRHYWIVDPMEPSMTAWELVDGRYAEAGHAEGDEELALERPFPVRIVPSGLIA